MRKHIFLNIVSLRPFARDGFLRTFVIGPHIKVIRLFWLRVRDLLQISAEFPFPSPLRRERTGAINIPNIVGRGRGSNAWRGASTRGNSSDAAIRSLRNWCPVAANQLPRYKPIYQ